MDFLRSVLVALLTNGLVAFVAQFGRRDAKLIVGRELAQKMKWEESALEPILQKALMRLVDSGDFEEWEEVPSLEVVCLFLGSPEAEAITRQIYANRFLDGTNEGSWAAIEKEFSAAFYLYVTAYDAYAGLQEEELVEVGKLLLGMVVKGCEETLNAAVDAGVLAAHEAKAVFRHRMLMDELAVLQENVALLTAQRRPDMQAILDFERKYRQQVGERHRYIVPPNFDRVRKLPIDDLYVQPKIASYKQIEGPTAASEMAMQPFLASNYRVVLLGNPGGGKSTFTHKLCYDLTMRYSERIFAERKEVTPILVVLRDYGAKKKEQNCSILEFMRLKANSDYQVMPPPSAFEYLLLNGRAVVIFDGLDELLDTHYRQEISNDVDSFCALYPSVPVLVTSREIGYEQAPLDEERFEVFRLAPFDKEQTREYAQKWFRTALDLTPEQQKQKAEAFLHESESVADLRSNPLLLALLCNIYREENYIPKNRPDVYEKCATMLFERWDKSRGIQVGLPFEAHVRPTMMYLAHWIYIDEGRRGGVTKERLVRKTAEYLYQRLFEDRDEAERAARVFIEFCEGRAWVFTDTGTTKEGEKLYQFTHQTFLEYFTAAYLVRTHSTPALLMNVLRPKILKREWDVVAQLAVHIQNKYVEGAGDKALTMLIGQAQKVTGDKLWNLSSFAVRCLEFLIPSPSIIQSIVSTFMEHFIEWGLTRLRENTSSYVGGESMYDPDETFISLLNAAPENRKTIATYLKNLLIDNLKGSNKQIAVIASELGLNLGTMSSRRNRRHIRNIRQDETGQFWRRVSDHISNVCSDQIAGLRQEYIQPCYSRGPVNVADLINWHGVEAIFQPCPFIMFPSSSWVPIAGSVFNGLSNSSKETLDTNTLRRLKVMGSLLLSYPPPWIRAQKSYRDEIIWNYENKRDPIRLRNLETDALFGAFLLVAVYLEEVMTISSEKIGVATRTIERVRYALSDYMEGIFLAYEDAAMMDRVQGEIERCQFTVEQGDFVWRWVRREVVLVEREAGKVKEV